MRAMLFFSPGSLFFVCFACSDTCGDQIGPEEMGYPMLKGHLVFVYGEVIRIQLIRDPNLRIFVPK